MKYTLFFLILIITSNASAQINANSIAGIWVDSTTQNRFEIVKIENAFTIKILALSVPLNDKGLPKTDEKNPVSSLRSRPILGMNIASGIVFDSKTSTWNGKEIYSPEKGITASCISLNFQVSENG
jgi:hypothetical protein